MARVALLKALLKAVKNGWCACHTNGGCRKETGVVLDFGDHSHALSMALMTAQRKMIHPSLMSCKNTMPAVAITNMGLGVAVAIKSRLAVGKSIRCWVYKSWVKRAPLGYPEQ